MATSTKPTLKYRVNTYKDVRTGAAKRRPVLVESETYGIERVVRYALDNAYMRGQYEDSKGNALGFLEAVKALAAAGKTVDIGDWFRVRAFLGGEVGESEQLTDANDYRVRILTLNELKMDKSLFQFVNAGTSARLSIQTIMSEGGKPGEITKTKTIRITGTNLAFDASLGDKVTAAWKDEDGETQAIALTPTASDYAAMTFAWPAAFAEIEVGTEVTFAVTLHGGDAKAAPKTVTKVAKLVA